VPCANLHTVMSCSLQTALCFRFSLFFLLRSCAVKKTRYEIFLVHFFSRVAGFRRPRRELLGVTKREKLGGPSGIWFRWVVGGRRGGHIGGLRTLHNGGRG
jgi:hypothetical protein